MADGDKGLLIATAVALIAFVVVGRVASSSEERADQQSGFAVLDGGARSAFRGGALPPGVSGVPAPRFVLDDARGGRVDTRRLRGRPYVVTFLYVGCKDVCPLIGAELKQALQRLGTRADDVTVIAVSADPRGDTRPAVRRWLAKLRMPDNLRYLIGSPEQMQPVWRSHYAAPQPEGDVNSAHTASIWLIDRRGRWRTKFSGGMPVAPADIAHDLRLLLDEPA
ncbi:MAG: SCO family protein [Actinomycetota bacterium]|nr:SCO family protein [Actinomycetota bacterium]